jgi:glutathione peroxidase
MWTLVFSLFLATSEAGVPNNMTLKGLNGDKIEAKEFEGKAILFVNVASRCGYTSQYEGLQSLYEDYKDKGLVIVGVPCNQFGGQEPGTATEIQTFCKVNYGVTFPLLEKQDVNGKNRSKLYHSLVSSDKGGGKNVRWNFEKFLVDKDGNVVGRYGSGVKPESTELKTAIDAALR